MAGVASKLAKYNYDNREFKMFFESLLYLVRMEDRKYNETEWDLGEYEDELVSIA